MLVIEKDGYYYNTSKHKCPSVRIVAQTRDKSVTFTEETKQQLHELEEIPLNIKLKDCKKVEDIKEGDILEVRGYRPARSSLIVNLSGEYYIGSHWLKEVITKQENKHTFNVIAGPIKTTPTKNRCRSFIKQ